MNPSLVRSLLCGPVLAALTLYPVDLSAATLTWDGDTGSDFSGLWESGVNWSTNAVPGAADIAQLLDVTTGTRTVTISSGSPQTINRLVITQSTAGAFNVLNVDDNLTVSGTGAAYSPFAITATSGQDGIVTNIADSKAVLVTNSTDTFTAAYAGTVNLGENATFIVKNTATVSDKFATATFAGPVTLGAGAKLGVEHGDEAINKQATLTMSGTVNIGAGATLVSASSSVVSNNKNATLTLDGATTVDTGGTIRVSTGNAASSGTGVLNVNDDLELAGAILVRGGFASATVASGTLSDWTPGSTVVLQAVNNGGSLLFTNAGTLEMDSAALTLDYASAGLSAGIRRFTNTGEWTLDNGATVSFTSTTGREIGNEGFGTGANNLNSGTLRVENGSRVDFMSLLNTGLMRAGSSTSGESDTVVRLGNSEGGTNFTGFRSVVLNNGHDVGNATLEILGDTWLGRTNSISDTYASLENGTQRLHTTASTSDDASTGNLIQIGDGATDITLTVANRNVRATNATGNVIDLTQNATLHMKSVEASSSGIVTVTNRGTFNHVGALVFETNNNSGSRRSFTHGAGSTYRISGGNASLRVAGGYHGLGAVLFTSSGVVTGSTAYDKLTYSNTTGNSGFDTLTLTMSGGEITAGNGTNGSGASSIGTLEFVNTNITLTGATKLSFDIGGLGNDEAPLDGDFNPILTFDRIVLSASRTFALGTGAILDIWMTNGFVTETAQTYTLIDTGLGGEGTISGSFATLLFQGQALDDDQYTVNIANGAVSITLAAGLGTPIPEPSTYATLLAAMTAGAALLRRRRCA